MSLERPQKVKIELLSVFLFEIVEAGLELTIVQAGLSHLREGITGLHHHA